MDIGHFDGFWQWMACTRLHADGEMPVEAILARVLGPWRSCAVCHLLRERALELASRWQYLLAEDPSVRSQFVESQTWCNRHAWFFKEVASPRTRGRLHRELYARLEARIGEMLEGDLSAIAGQSAPHVLHCLTGNRACPLCDDEAAFQEVVLEELAHGLVSGRLRSAYQASAGCCLPHLGALVHTIPDADTVRFLLETTADRLKRLVKELDTYETETESHRRRYGPAADAPTRALVDWVGMRGMVRESLCRDGMSGRADAKQGESCVLPPSRSGILRTGGTSYQSGEPGLFTCPS